MIEPFRFATWNIHAGRDVYDHSLRQAESDVVGQFDAIALQEVEFESGGVRLASHSRAVVDAIGLPYFAGYPTSQSQFADDLGFGVALMSRVPLRPRRKLLLPNPMHASVRRNRLLWSHDKGLLECQVTWNDLDVSLVSAHLIPFHMFSREAGHPDYEEIWNGFRSFMRGSSEHWCVGGDFNAEDRTLLLRDFPGSSSAVRGKSTRPSGLSHDDVLCSSELTVRSSHVIPTASDHDLVCATVVLKSPPEAGRVSRTT